MKLNSLIFYVLEVILYFLILENSKECCRTLKQLWPNLYEKITKSEKIAEIENNFITQQYIERYKAMTTPLPPVPEATANLNISINLSNSLPENTYQYTVNSPINNINNGLFSNAYSGYNNYNSVNSTITTPLYETYLEKELLLKAKLDSDEKLLQAQKLQELASNLAFDEKCRLLQAEIIAQQAINEAEALKKSRDCMASSLRGLSFNYLDGSLNIPNSITEQDHCHHHTKCCRSSSYNDRLRRQISNDYVYDSYLGPDTCLVQSSRQNSCYLKSIENLTNELNYIKSSRLNSWTY